MESEVIRPIVRLGNSAGVVLPKEWLYGKAKIVLLEKKTEPEQEIFQILSAYLKNITALAIVGSYARGEQTADSDVDVLVITNSTNKRVKNGKYEIILVSEDKIQKYLDANILPLLPMLIESKSLINKELIDKLRNIKLTKKNLSFHFETTKTAMKVVKAEIELAKEMEEDFVKNRTAYSLVLRLRELYIVECLIHGRMWNKRDFLRLIKEKSGSLKAYDGYLMMKNKEKNKILTLPLEEASKLYNYIYDEIKKQEKEWVKIRN